jgi:hypothetical protein
MTVNCKNHLPFTDLYHSAIKIYFCQFLVKTGILDLLFYNPERQNLFHKMKLTNVGISLKFCN